MKKIEVASVILLSGLLAACGGSSDSESNDSSSSSSSSSSVGSSSSSVSSSASSSSSDFTFEGDPESVLSCEAANTVHGFASLGDGTSGGSDVGSGYNEVTVDTGEALRTALSNSSYEGLPLTIYVDGLITWENSGEQGIKIQRNDVSIIGMPGARFQGVGLEIRHGASNIIIRNLTMSEVPQSHGAGDIISLDGRDGPIRNIWIDHNELYNDLDADIPADCTSDCNQKDYFDELVSGRGDVANITISYNYLHDSWKTSLWGSSDDDSAHRKVTFQGNHWQNAESRMPLYRFGEAHVFNSYYSNITSSGVNSRMGATIRVDGTVFEDSKNPIVSFYSDEVGYWDLAHNIFDNVDWAGGSGSDITAGPDPESTVTYVPPYDYPLIDPQYVKAHVLANAGAGVIDDCL